MLFIPRMLPTCGMMESLVAWCGRELRHTSIGLPRTKRRLLDTWHDVWHDHLNVWNEREITLHSDCTVALHSAVKEIFIFPYRLTLQLFLKWPFLNLWCQQFFYSFFMQVHSLPACSFWWQDISKNPMPLFVVCAWQGQPLARCTQASKLTCWISRHGTRLLSWE